MGGADAAAAAGWSEQVSDPTLRQHLVAAVSVSFAEQDGATAATLATKSLEPGEEQDRTVVAIVQRWAQTSPAEAASWVAQFEDTPAHAAAAENLVTIWTLRDSESVSEWLQGLPEGTLRRTGLMAYARALRARGPAFTASPSPPPPL